MNDNVEIMWLSAEKRRKCIIAVFLRIIIPKIIRGGDNMPKTGEKPGAGQYTCKECGKTLTLDDETDKLPPCSNCGGTEFK